MPADIKTRQRALDTGASFIVQAPAGSGKTEVLTQRFLKLLATVERPERVLAITFTRKATQEMRTRVSTRLRQAQAGERPEKAHDRQAVELAADVLNRDRRLGWDLIGNPGRLRITTIDGLCMQVLARDPVSGPRWAGARILEDARPLYRESVRRLFADIDEIAERGPEGRRAQEALVGLLGQTGGDARRLENLLMDMLKRRSLWLRHLGAGHDELVRVLEIRQEHALDSFGSALGDAPLEEAMEITARLGFEAGVKGSGLAADLRAAMAFARCLCTGARKPRAPGGIKAGLFPGMEEADSGALERLKEIYGAWHANDAAKEAIERMASWPPLDVPLLPEGLPDSLLDDARTILSLTVVELKALMAGGGQADFTAVAEAALESLGSDTEPSDSLLAEDTRIDHILMDEFQDTSATQFDLLRRITAGWQPADGRTLFLVGDPMQSIYRFREANVGFFNEVVRSGRLGQVAVEALTLTSNFRSRVELIEWFNRAFSGVFPEHDEIDSGAVAYTPVSPELEPGGAVELLAWDRGGDSTASPIVDLVARTLADAECESIAILVRSRRQVGRITAELSGAGIEFEAVDMDALSGRPVIQDLLLLTRALSHPLDRIAWLGLLRAPWCGLKLADIHRVAGEDPMTGVLESIEFALAEGVLEDDTQRRLKRLHAVMRYARRLAPSRSLARRVEMCWIELGGPLCCSGEADLDDAETFLELLEEVEQAGRHEIVERLEEALEERYAASRPARVQIMTIHNAKGLEFDTVIIPDLERGTGRTDQPLVAVQEFADAGTGSAVLMAAQTPSWMAEVSIYRYLNRVDAERLGYESQRILYVACTRARKSLALVAGLEFTSKGMPRIPSQTFLSLLEPPFRSAIQALQSQRENSFEAAGGVDADPPALPLLRLNLSLPDPQLEDAPQESSEPGLPDLPNREATALGEVLHRWLELMHDAPGMQWDEARIAQSESSIRSSLLRAGAPQDALDHLMERCMTILGSITNSENLYGWLDKGVPSRSWSELPIFQREGSGFTERRIDLLFEDEAGAMHIVDYKTSGEAEGGPYADARQAQLERYRELVERLGAGPVVETAIRILDRGDGRGKG